MLQSLKALQIINAFIGHCKSLKKSLRKGLGAAHQQGGEEFSIVLSIRLHKEHPQKMGTCLPLFTGLGYYYNKGASRAGPAGIPGWAISNNRVTFNISLRAHKNITEKHQYQQQRDR